MGTARCDNQVKIGLHGQGTKYCWQAQHSDASFPLGTALPGASRTDRLQGASDFGRVPLANGRQRKLEFSRTEASDFHEHPEKRWSGGGGDGHRGRSFDWHRRGAGQGGNLHADRKTDERLAALLGDSLPHCVWCAGKLCHREAGAQPAHEARDDTRSDRHGGKRRRSGSDLESCGGIRAALVSLSLGGVGYAAVLAGRPDPRKTVTDGPAASENKR
jgi:hypothetical protein